MSHTCQIQLRNGSTNVRVSQRAANSRRCDRIMDRVQMTSLKKYVIWWEHFSICQKICFELKNQRKTNGTTDPPLIDNMLILDPK